MSKIAVRGYTQKLEKKGNIGALGVMISLSAITGYWSLILKLQ